ncbi:MAG: hypothetical protein K2Y39_19980 [Candidatus Obscuribacterales bacterium]|nr:hypothetical protein [Candidatus Obscuribacterales bacterium]MBX9951459.1 hypothetical protein [Candidatus Obscuribacterales bacterium]
MASSLFLCVSISLAVQAAAPIVRLEDKTRYDEPEIQNPYGRNPHGPNPHGPDPHDEVHDKDMPSNNPDRYFNGDRR